MFPIEYIRTDRNGTKYFADWTCPRCGGAGQAEKWVTTGKLCYGCGGTGRRPKPLIVKKYTPEHEAKLEARRKAREAKRLAENPPPSEDVLWKRAEEPDAMYGRAKASPARASAFYTPARRTKTRTSSTPPAATGRPP